MLTKVLEFYFPRAGRFVRVTKHDAVAEPMGYTCEYGQYDPETHREQTLMLSEPMHCGSRTDAIAMAKRFMTSVFEIDQGVAEESCAGERGGLYPHLPQHATEDAEVSV